MEKKKQLKVGLQLRQQVGPASNRCSLEDEISWIGQWEW